ncbi:MAG: glycosyltransferase family 2 protein [Bacteroidota bacterium]
MVPVSIVIITKNEAETIANCLSVCSLISDDVIVVDNGSTDDTLKIVQQQGCRIYEETWDGYGANKNKGANYAHYDWILSIDADEIPDQQFINSLRYINLNNPNWVFDIRFKSYFGEKLVRFGNWGYDHRIRLFNRKLVKWSTAIVHEKLLLPPAAQVKKIKGHLHHFTVGNLKECNEKAVYYARLSAEQYINSGQKFSTVKFYMSPVFGFIKNYIAKLGFLDGYVGWNIALLIYKNTWLKYHYIKQELKQPALKNLDMEY